LIGDIADRHTWKGETEDGEVAQALADEGHDVAALLIILSVAQWLVDSVEFGNFGPSLLLDVGALSEKSSRPLQKSSNGIEAAREHSEGDGGEFGVVELGFFVEDNVGLDAWLVCSLLHAVLESLVQCLQVDVAAISHLTSPLRAEAEWVESEDRNVILEIASGAAKAADLLLDRGDFFEEDVVLAAHAGSPVQGQGETERQALETWHRVDSNGTFFTISKEFINEVLGFEIQVRNISLHGRTVESRSSTLATAL